MSYSSNKSRYLELLKQFINDNIGVIEFDQQFSVLWKKDRDEEWAKIHANPERLDLKLINELSNGASTQEQFALHWETSVLNGAQAERQVCEILAEVFTSLDAYDEKPQQDYEIDEATLKKALLPLAQKLEDLNDLP